MLNVFLKPLIPFWALKVKDILKTPSCFFFFRQVRYPAEEWFQDGLAAQSDSAHGLACNEHCKLLHVPGLGLVWHFGQGRVRRGERVGFITVDAFLVGMLINS